MNIDKLPSAGYGPTSNSCAIVRAHYSSFDGVAMAYEGFFYWKDWAEYLERRRTSPGLARVHALAAPSLLESATGPPREGAAALRRDLGVAVRGVGHRRRSSRSVPIFDVHEFWPPSRARTTRLRGASARGSCRARSTRPTRATSPTRSSPPTTSSVRRRKRAGGEFLFNRRGVVAIDKDASGRVAGVTLDDGTEDRDPGVRRECRRPALLQGQRDGRRRPPT